MTQADLFGAVVTADGDRDCWATPPDWFAEIDRRFNFSLDVCALPWSAKCGSYYTPEIDGLRQDWRADAKGGAAWCNPPFSDIAPWARAAYDFSLRGLTTVCILPANRCEQGWWQAHVGGCRNCNYGHMVHIVNQKWTICRGGYSPKAEVVAIPGRVNYVPPPGITSSGAEFPSCLAIYWGVK